MATLNRNLLTTFTKAAADAARTYETYTDETNAELVAERTAALRKDILPEVRNLLDTTSEPADRDRVKKAIGVDYTDPASVAAVPMKWDQVTQLLDAGQTWGSIIDQADLPMLAAIVENAPTHLAATGQDHRAVHDIDQMAARRAAQLGHNPAKTYMTEQAQRAYNQVVASKITRQLEGNQGLAGVERLAELWDREAETAAAKVLGEPTPNERDMADTMAERSQQFEQEATQAGYAPGESPAELAAKVSRGY
jgi:hypothetical protein